MASIDFNCDMGESFGAWSMGDDSNVLRFITSANTACGFHAGDPDTMRQLVRDAKARGVVIGAHPGLPDLQGFGRRVMAMSADEVYALTLYQVGALSAFTRAAGVPLHHVKTHGALYSMTMKSDAIADAVVTAVRDFDPTLMIYVANDSMVRAAQRANMPVAFEVYADRTYQDDGTITPRSQANAMIHDSDAAIAQVRRMVHEGVVRAVSGKDVPIVADTVCLHGDRPDAAEFAERLRRGLEADGITIAPPKARRLPPLA